MPEDQSAAQVMPPAESSPQPVGADVAGDDDDDSSSSTNPEQLCRPPFETRSFGGEFVWGQGDAYVAKVLRVRVGQRVKVSSSNRCDMVIMLTGGRAMLEIEGGTDVDRVELMPAEPVNIDPGSSYRLVALTDVELFNVYSPLARTRPAPSSG